MKNRVLHTSNFGNGIKVKYFDKDGKLKVNEYPIDWYFAIKKEDEEKAIELIDGFGYKYKIKHDSKFPEYTLIYLKNYRDLDRTKYDVVLYLEENEIVTYEGDLPNDKRWYVDKQVTIANEFRKLYFDIETDDSIGKIEIGRDRILSWAAIDDKGKIFFEKLEALNDIAEEELLKKFLKLIKRYDILLGWNSKEFDIPYLKMRMRKFGLHRTKDYTWNEVANFDLLKRFRHIFRFDNGIKRFNLDYVANHFLGKGKIPHKEPIHVLHRDNPALLEEYNIEDCILVKELDEKLGVSNMMILQSQWCGVPPSQFGLYAIIDSFIMKTAHNVGQFCRTSVKAIKDRLKDNFRGSENPDEFSKEEAKYTGAAVIEPITGIYKKVYTFDFKSLYPSMMRTSNIGFDSLSYVDDGKNIINPGTAIVKRKSGGLKPTYFRQGLSVINLAITELLQKRKEYKKLKLQMIEEGTNKGPAWERVVSDEIIVKELANSTYGIMGLEYGRYFSVDIAESITLFGQWVINYAKKFFESRNYLVIYGDTDSVFVAAGKPMDQHEELKMFHEELKKELKINYRAENCYIELEPDKIFETLILVAKKSYVGHVTDIEGKKTNDLYVRGLDYIKKNTFSFAAKKQKELIELILRGNGDQETVRTFLDEARKEFYSRDFEAREVAITQRIGKSAKDYKVPPLAALLAAEVEEKTGVVQHRTEVEFIITRGVSYGDKNIERSQGVLIDDYTGNFDRDYYWTNKTIPALERITKIVFPDVIDYYTGSRSLFELESKAEKIKYPSKRKKRRFKKVDETDQLKLF